MASVIELTAQNQARWNTVEIDPAKAQAFKSVAERLLRSKDRYQLVADKTGVPWYVIAVIHERESGGNWGRGLANGEPWNKKTRLVPAGIGPFKSWEDAAVYALTNCAPYAARWHDWSEGGSCTILEKYNGLGYANRKVPSPYVWAGTNQYEKGKYVRDGVYDPNHVDQQLGCAGLLKELQVLDPTIWPVEVPVAEAEASDQELPEAAPAPAKKSTFELLVSILMKLFGVK